MFLEFYGLNEQPFGVTPDPRFIYPSRTYSKAFNSLSCGIEAGRGFQALIAKPGMGKTTLVFQLLKQLKQTSRAVFLFDTLGDSGDLLRHLLSALQLDVAEQDQDIVSMHRKLNQVLVRELLAGRRFVLIIDECQNLDDSVLETVRLLSNFETPQTKLMQIILVGQTQLADKLLSPSLAQLRQRISILSHLEPLTWAETVWYIEHRLQVAGYVGAPLFTPGALEQIWEHCEGTPRNINNLCFNALLAGYDAGRKQIDCAIVDQVLADLGMNSREPQSMVTEEQPPAVPRAPTIPYSDVFETDLDSNQGDYHDARAVVVEPEATLPEPVPQVLHADVPAPTQRAPLSYASVTRGDFSGLKQVHSGDGPKVVSDSSSNLPVSEPQNTQPLAPPRKAQSASTVRCDFSGQEQVASASVDNLVALFEAIYPTWRTSQTGQPAVPPPQRGSELSPPAVSEGSLGRSAMRASALGVVLLALTGLLSFYSRGRGGRQLHDALTSVEADVVTPVPAPRGTVPVAVPTPATSRATARSALVQSFLTPTLGLKIGSIVIDPGHGGHDTGAVGPTGLMEKDLCLDVALRLGQIIKLRLPGAEVIFTRTDDKFMALEKRTNIANEKKAELFLSIHANSSPYDAARGVETYYSNLKGGSEGLEVAARENATAQGTVSDLPELVKKIARSDKIEESRQFAEDIQSSLSRRIQHSAKSAQKGGVHRAPFVVLRGANMPSVLTEISFLSNPSDEQLLMKDEYRQRLAEGLYQGVASYLQSLNRITYNLPGGSAAADRSSSGGLSAEAAAVEQSRNRQ